MKSFFVRRLKIGVVGALLIDFMLGWPLGGGKWQCEELSVLLCSLFIYLLILGVGLMVMWDIVKEAAMKERL